MSQAKPYGPFLEEVPSGGAVSYESSIPKLNAHSMSHGLAEPPLTGIRLEDVKAALSNKHYKMLEDHRDLEVALGTLDQQAFDRLVFIENDKTQHITTDGRSLRQVALHINQHGRPVQEFLNSSDWFRDVEPIYKYFDYDKFAPLLLRPTNHTEQQKSDGGLWYLKDGNHRALALAIKMHLENFPFKEIDAVFVSLPN